MKKIVPIALVLALLFGATHAQADGQVDPEFGRGGKVLLPSGPREGLGTALLPDGRVVVAGAKQMVAFLPSGDADRGFGESGSVPLFMPPGSSSASIADVLVDSSGRLVVVGLADSKVLVERFTPDGRLDPSFGGGDGYSISDFGLPPADPGVPPTVFVPPPTDVPQLSGLRATLDGNDRIVIAGVRQSGWQQVKTYWVGASEPFLARFTAEGEEDREFAGDAAVQLPGFSFLGRPAADPDGGIYVAAFRPAGTMLIHFLPQGTLDSGFGENGGRPLPGGTTGNVVLDGSAGLLLDGSLQGSREPGLPAGSLIKRLWPDGSRDRSFGRGGAAALRIPRMLYGVVAADPRGGVLVGLPRRGHRKLKKRSAAPSGLALARLRPDGSLDKSFGRRGMVMIPLGRDWEVTLREVEQRGTEVLLSGGWCGGGDCGGVLAKIDLGSG